MGAIEREIRLWVLEGYSLHYYSTSEEVSFCHNIKEVIGLMLVIHSEPLFWICYLIVWAGITPSVLYTCFMSQSSVDLKYSFPGARTSESPIRFHSDPHLLDYGSLCFWSKLGTTGIHPKLRL